MNNLIYRLANGEPFDATEVTPGFLEAARDLKVVEETPEGLRLTEEGQNRARRAVEHTPAWRLVNDAA